MTRDELTEVFGATFPIAAETGTPSLEFVSVSEAGDAVVLRLVVWDRRGETLSIRDVKEQEITLGTLPDRARFEAYLSALADVVARVLGSPEAHYYMPHDLFDRTSLKLVKAQTKLDFIAALEKKSRLGKYLPAS